MNEELQETIIDLLIQKATIGLGPEELTHLDRLKAEGKITEDGSFELAAAAIGLVDLDTDEKLPGHLAARIAASADEFFDGLPQPEAIVAPTRAEAAAHEDEFQQVFTVEPRRSWNWLGWALAAAACIALAVNVWFTRVPPQEIGSKFPTPATTPEKLTAQQEYASLIASDPNMIKASWGAGSMKDLKEVGGDVGWSAEKQKGFMLLRGLPVNDPSKQTYQLWIVDKTRDAKHPVDGGVFDVPSGGEVVIPIKAKLLTLKPEMFVITVEQPGGVVVSEQGKVAAIAKVETKTKPNA